jgi:hypothetical protein
MVAPFSSPAATLRSASTIDSRLTLEPPWPGCGTLPSFLPLQLREWADFPCRFIGVHSSLPRQRTLCQVRPPRARLGRARPRPRPLLHEPDAAPASSARRGRNPLSIAPSTAPALVSAGLLPAAAVAALRPPVHHSHEPRENTHAASIRTFAGSTSPRFAACMIVVSPRRSHPSPTTAPRNAEPARVPVRATASSSAQ